eukprot:COSAG06_NODE_11330_length_1527_cov_3.645658_1_plen_45_part_10
MLYQRWPAALLHQPIHHGELLLLLLLSFDIQFEATALRTLGLPLR